MEKTYTYKGKEYLARKKSFKPYRIKAIQFIDKYNEFEAKYISPLQNEINTFLFTNKDVAGKITGAKNADDDKLFNESIRDALISHPEYAIKARNLAAKKVLAREMFLTTDCNGNVSDENAKMLSDIMFEECGDINHNPENEDEYNEYLVFIYKLWDDFFLKYKV